jgi:glycosyltransferase involved in cell wall biosynthesis
VAAVISNGDLGWCAPAPIAPDAKRIHMYHGTYRGQAEAIRLFISHRGYLYLKCWSSGVLERLGGRKRIVLCNSDQTREEVSRFFGHYGAVVWLPLDTAHFRPSDPRQCRVALGFAETERVGLFVGSTAPAKGFGTVRKLIDALPEVHWILAIGGQVAPDLENTKRVRVFRDVSEERLPAIYGAADFLVCPSYYESFGYVMAEALACGTPVIASPGGASRTFLKDLTLDHLLISDPSSIDQFAMAAREVLRAPEFYRQKVEELIRPKLVELMSPENWWRRFCEMTGL